MSVSEGLGAARWHYDYAAPRAPRSFAPAKFVPWVEARLREGFEVHVVYDLASSTLDSAARCSRLAHRYVMLPQKFDERNTLRED